MAAVTRLDEALRVLATCRGKGLIADDHPLAGGVLDHRGPSLVEVISDPDLV